MAPFDATIDGAMLRRVNALGADLDGWEQYWYGEHHARGFDANGFFLESLRLQGATARLYLCCTCLRGVHQPGDAERMTEAQREISQSTVRAADLVLDIATGSSATSAEYYEKLRWAPIYTHVTATFACVFLLKCVVLFPSLVDAHSIFARAEKLALRLRETAAAKVSSREASHWASTADTRTTVRRRHSTHAVADMEAHRGDQPQARPAPHVRRQDAAAGQLHAGGH